MRANEKKVLVNYFAILEIPFTADSDAVKKAYRSAAMKHHPDRNPGDEGAAERFKKATEAFEFLRDPRNLASHARECQQPSGFQTQHETRPPRQPTSPPQSPSTPPPAYKTAQRDGYNCIITPDGYEIPLVPGMTVDRFNELIKNDPNLIQFMSSYDMPRPVRRAVSPPTRKKQTDQSMFGMDQSHLFGMPEIRKNY